MSNKLTEAEAAVAEAEAAAAVELGETEDVTLYVRDADEEYAYNKWGHLELIGTIGGTHGGRFMLAAVAENAAGVWPYGTAVYVKRVKK